MRILMPIFSAGVRKRPSSQQKIPHHLDFGVFLTLLTRLPGDFLEVR